MVLPPRASRPSATMRRRTCAIWQARLHGRSARRTSPWAVRAPGRHATTASIAPPCTRFCRGADLFLNVSGCCWLRDEYRGARRTAYLDSDPGYTQAKLWAAEHDCATDGSALLGQPDPRSTTASSPSPSTSAPPDCRVPRCGLDWQPTRQPVVLEHWPLRSMPQAAPLHDGDVVEDRDAAAGHRRRIAMAARTSSSARFLRPAAAARRSALEVAIAGAAPRAELRGARLACGRRPRALDDDGSSISTICRASRGEWSVAKNVYVALRSGWFSTRSALVPGLGQAGGRAGHGLERALSDRCRAVRVRHGRGRRGRLATVEATTGATAKRRGRRRARAFARAC